MTGNAPDEQTYELVSSLFLRLFAVIYLIAFVSIGIQIDALAGPDGILPLAPHLEGVWAAQGLAAVLANPSIFWLSSETWALEGAAILGSVFSVLLFFGYLPRISAAVLFLLYLSLVGAGSVFMNFQWDGMLLEMGFLAVFLPGGSRLIVHLYRWLLFRLRFLSGLFKVLSNDPYWLGLPALVGGEGAWQGFTALHYYFETQPIPHVGAWYAHHLPEALLTAAVGVVFFLELVVPFMMFMGRRYRLFAAWATILFQVAVMLTSNHNFFNILTLVLCLFLFDDRALKRVLPGRIEAWLRGTSPRAPETRTTRPAARAVAAVVVPLSIALPVQIMARDHLPSSVNSALDAAKNYHIAHPYHVFPVMNRERIEVVVEGSLDTLDWREYEFRFKPGDPMAAPKVSQPHHPRLDWMLWFVPSGRADHQFWLPGLARALHEGSPPVLALFAENPFPEAPPTYVRFSYYRYRFTTPEERTETGAWWVRTFLQPVTPFPWFRRPPGADPVGGGTSG